MIGGRASNAGISAAPRILVVHPLRSHLGVIARRLSEQGFQISAADSVQNAIAELYRLPIDLVLAELVAPGFCGRALVSMVRDDVVLNDLPILLMAGRSNDQAKIDALRGGADGVIRKPFHFEVLVARIQRELERRRAIETLRQDNRALDARIVERSIAIGELRDRLAESEAERHRLRQMAGPTAIR